MVGNPGGTDRPTGWSVMLGGTSTVRLAEALVEPDKFVTVKL
jgi:hypothetical protein